MPTKMFFSLPLDSKTPAASIKQQARDVAKIYEADAAKKARKANKNPDDDTTPAEDSSSDEDNGGGGWRGRGGDGAQPPRKLAQFHKENGFSDILAWSGGGGAGRRRRRWNNSGYGNDVSLTLWFEHNLPSAMIACLRGEYLPRAFLRIFHGAEDGQFKVLEHELESCLISSCYTGGSGGEDRFTANLTVSYNKMSTRSFIFDIVTGDLVSEATGSFDTSAKTGTRTGTDVPSLTSMCEQYCINNKADFDKKDLINLIRLGVPKVAPSELGVDQSLLSMPRNGRRFRVIKANSADASKDVFLKTLTFEALKTACLHALEVAEADFEYISAGDDQGRLIEIYKNEHVEYLAADTTVYFFTKETEEEKAERLERESKW
eukprot:TRINITY_DN10137_c0_g1_i1.p1 TRINITY_DN10137_c0_g1~~TRINITY_DN10137_c0_g1_i1.p1  ORF type:complete len:376 (+),score=105.02 TRINITY_DN10137_c0_g1_i1:65-1192(+)